MPNRLRYSAHSAYRRLLSEDDEIRYSLTTTGDGFCIWNCARTTEADIALYKLMMLIPTDNVAAGGRWPGADA